MLYPPTPTENIIDIALTLSGAVEGVWALLAANPAIDLRVPLSVGLVLTYEPAAAIRPDLLLAMGGTVFCTGDEPVYIPPPLDFHFPDFHETDFYAS